jgi:hypothetical protein
MLLCLNATDCFTFSGCLRFHCFDRDVGISGEAIVDSVDASGHAWEGSNLAIHYSTSHFASSRLVYAEPSHKCQQFQRQCL